MKIKIIALLVTLAVFTATIPAHAASGLCYQTYVDAEQAEQSLFDWSGRLTIGSWLAAGLTGANIFVVGFVVFGALGFKYHFSQIWDRFEIVRSGLDGERDNIYLHYMYNDVLKEIDKRGKERDQSKMPNSPDRDESRYITATDTMINAVQSAYNKGRLCQIETPEGIVNGNDAELAALLAKYPTLTYPTPTESDDNRVMTIKNEILPISYKEFVKVITDEIEVASAR